MLKRKEQSFELLAGKKADLSSFGKNSYQVPLNTSTTAPVERLFSVAGKYFWRERCRLTDKAFEKLIYIKCDASLQIKA